MIPGRWRAAVGAGLGFLFVGSQALAYAPEDVVRALYAEPAIVLDPSRSAGYFSRDLDAALKADSHPGEVGAIDFDYRYGAQDVEVTGLQFISDVDNDEARVVAVFKNFGKPESVDWTLCRRANGDWRIADASSNTGPHDWDLRLMLKLPADRVGC